MGGSMDQEIIWDVFSNTLEAAAELGVHDGFTAAVKQALERLALPKIGSDGRLQEWSEEFSEPEPGHRHMSHLFGVHPGCQFTLLNAPEMVAAARKSIEYRLANGGGHTGRTGGTLDARARQTHPRRDSFTFGTTVPGSPGR